MITTDFTALFPFCGLGGGALGFADAEVRMLGRVGRFRVLGGLDFDADACADFEHLAQAPSWCVDVADVTAAELRARYGARAPDVVFLSPPCKGASALLSKAAAATEKYRAMNRLAVVWARVMLEAWPDPPGLVLLENVPRLTTRAPGMLEELRSLLTGAGYVLTDGYHDCGEIGGLAQRRRRFLLVARHPGRVPPLLYQPPRRRVRACGEVLEALPVPGTVEAGELGPLHELPRISWTNWVRLALIPAGGDWRDLDGVLADGQARREQWARHGVQAWNEPTGCVAGTGSNGVWAVADPRVARAFDAGYAVLDWSQAARTVAGTSAVGCGAYAVADPRLKCAPRSGAYGVLSWSDPSTTVIGLSQIDHGRFAVADPRRPPPSLPVIIAADGTWHRPMTALELAVLQGLPAEVRGSPLRLAGSSRSAWRERIGNAVPAPAARAVAERMLVALLEASAGAWSLSSGGEVWVERELASRVNLTDAGPFKAGGFRVA